MSVDVIDHKAALKKTMSDITGDLGRDGAITWGNNPNLLRAGFLSTGSWAVDAVIGGGFPLGLITEIYGPAGTSKTTLAFAAIAQAQRGGRLAAYVNVERRYRANYAKQLGVNIQELVVVEAKSAEKILEAVRKLVATGLFGIIVIDSVAGLARTSEHSGRVGDSHAGKLDEIIDQGLRLLKDDLADSNTALVLLNQIREDPSVRFGSPEFCPGGRAVQHYASVRLDMRTEEYCKDEHDRVYGQIVRVKVVKNSVDRPFQNILFENVFGAGPSRECDLVELGLLTGVVEKPSGSATRHFGKVRLGGVGVNAARYLRNNPGVADQIEKAIRVVLEADDVAYAEPPR